MGWNRYPALLYGTVAALSCGVAFSQWALVLPLTLLIWQRPRHCSLIATATMLYCLFFYQIPQTPDEGAQGSGLFYITAINETSKYGPKWILRGVLKTFSDEEGHLIAKNVPCSTIVSKKQQRPSANREWVVTGNLQDNLLKALLWEEGNPHFNLAEWRLRSKNRMRTYIRARYTDPAVRRFLLGMTTGDFDDPLLSQSFGRFGLKHIMAISGFHFAIVAALLGSFFRRLIPQKLATASLLLCISTYFLFLGCSASILRAWVMIVLATASTLVQRTSNSKNNLGVALITVVLWDPLLCLTLGFQFSFLITAAILFFFGPIERKLRRLFPKRSREKWRALDRLDQHAATLLNYLRPALALTLAVHTIALPYSLFYFQKFPLLGLFYNLFFPLLVSFSILLLFIGLHSLNALFTKFVLNLTLNMPLTFDYVIRTSPLPTISIVLYLTILFFVGLQIQQNRHPIPYC